MYWNVNIPNTKPNKTYNTKKCTYIVHNNYIVHIYSSQAIFSSKFSGERKIGFYLLLFYISNFLK